MENGILARRYFPQGGEHVCAGTLFVGCLHDFFEFVCNEQLKRQYANQVEYFISCQYRRTKPKLAEKGISSDCAAGSLLSWRLSMVSQFNKYMLREL
jgi:hypothetical protein